MRFCQLRLKVVMARCPGLSASGPWPKHGPHHDSRIWPPAPRRTSAIDAPPNQWDSPLAVFEYVYKHECKVSGLINDLVDLAAAEKDHAASAFLQWFVTEQVEEEATVQQIIDDLERTKGNGHALLMLDREMGARPGGNE